MYRYSYQIELYWDLGEKLIGSISFTSLDSVFKYFEETKDAYDPQPIGFRVYVDRIKIKK